jgi:hypothetical protein
LSVRQSVTIPAQLAAEVRRLAKERHLTASRALVALAERGVKAEAAARENLNTAYRRFMSEADPEKKARPARIWSEPSFEEDAIAEDPVR